MYLVIHDDFSIVTVHYCVVIAYFCALFDVLYWHTDLYSCIMLNTVCITHRRNRVHECIV